MPLVPFDALPEEARIWIFASGLTNVEVDLRVRDSVTGQVRTYHSPPNTTFAPVLDTTGFACP